MKKIFIGFLFIFLNFSVTINGTSISILPDFIGYIFLYLGIKELLSYSPHFVKAKVWALILAVYYTAVYSLNLFGVINSNGFLAYILFALNIVGLIGEIYMAYHIIQGVDDLESSCENTDFNYLSLYKYWKLMIVFEVLSVLCVMIPIINFVLLIVSIIISIIFLVQLYRSQKLYEQYKFANG